MKDTDYKKITKAMLAQALQDEITGKAPAGHTHTEADITDIGTHTHDGRYYTKSNIDIFLAGYAAKSPVETHINDSTIHVTPELRTKLVNLPDNPLTSMPDHNHNDLYYLKSEIDSRIAGTINKAIATGADLLLISSGAGAWVAISVADLKVKLGLNGTLNDTGTGSTDIWSAAKVLSAIAVAGGGDMLVDVYDPDKDGKVSSAEVADSANAVDWNNVVGRPAIPTKTSDLQNDSDFIPSSGTISNSMAVNGIGIWTTTTLPTDNTKIKVGDILIETS